MSIHAELSHGPGEIPLLPGTANVELNPARSAINTALIGLPRGQFGALPAEPECMDFREMLETADLGPFTVTGLRPAVRSLRAIITDISLEAPEIYDRLGCTEMLACRNVKGSKSIVSSHAWGVALDLTIDGYAQTDGADDVMEALLQLFPIFNRHGFYWGYAFRLADALHFEASDELIRSWANAGAFGAAGSLVLPRALNIGDRGPMVHALQAALNRCLQPVRIPVDGFYGPQTRMAVFALQREAGLPPTGAAPKPVLAYLGLN